MDNLQAAILESRGSAMAFAASDGQRFQLQQVFRTIGNAMKSQGQRPGIRIQRPKKEANRSSRSPTTVSAFPPSTPRASSSFSTGCTPALNIPATASVWRSAKRSSNGTAAGSRPYRGWGRHYFQIFSANWKTGRRSGPGMNSDRRKSPGGSHPADLDLIMDYWRKARGEPSQYRLRWAEAMASSPGGKIR